jgi:hypothetical protein
MVTFKVTGGTRAPAGRYYRPAADAALGDFRLTHPGRWIHLVRHTLSTATHSKLLVTTTQITHKTPMRMARLQQCKAFSSLEEAGLRRQAARAVVLPVGRSGATDTEQQGRQVHCAVRRGHSWLHAARECLFVC